MPTNSQEEFPTAHYEAIGRLAVACSKLDDRMTEMIAIFSGQSLVHAMITVHHQNFSGKSDSMKALLEISGFLDDDSLSKIVALFDNAKALYDYRNGILHGTWGLTPEGEPVVTRFSARGKFHRSRNPRPTDEILAKAASAFSIANELASFRDFIALQRTQTQAASD